MKWRMQKVPQKPERTLDMKMRTAAEKNFDFVEIPLIIGK